jgi:hypothetical protein
MRCHCPQNVSIPSAIREAATVFSRLPLLQTSLILILLFLYIIVPDIDDVMSKKRNSIVKSSGEGEKERSRVLPWKFTPFPTFVARVALYTVL